MNLTLNTYPNNIDNSGAFNITNDLVEDTTHVNLRIRADITVNSVVVAMVEKPKGIPDFDFSDILKSLVPGLTFARDSGQIAVVAGTLDAVSCPLVAYTILFTEIWEDEDGVTQTGETDDASSTTFRFVPAKGDGTAFAEYVLHDDTSLFTNKTLRNNVTKFYTSNPSEYWIVFFTEVANCELFYSKDDAASYEHEVHFSPVNGWGVIIVNIGELMASVTSNLRIQLGDADSPYSKISEVFTIYADSSQIDERVVLEYDGLVGGKEYLAFEGLKDIEFTTIRNYYQTSKKNRKPLSLMGIGKQKVETRFKDINNSEYLKSLMISEDVKRLESSYAAPIPVTIVSDTVKIGSSEMFSNQLELEYEY